MTEKYLRAIKLSLSIDISFLNRHPLKWRYLWNSIIFTKLLERELLFSSLAWRDDNENVPHTILRILE